MQDRCKQDRFLRSKRFCVCLFWEKRQEEVPLSTMSSAGGEGDEG